MFPSRSPASVDNASRYAPARLPSGTLRTSSWRASMSARRSPSGPSHVSSWIMVAASGRRACRRTATTGWSPRPRSESAPHGADLDPDEQAEERTDHGAGTLPDDRATGLIGKTRIRMMKIPYCSRTGRSCQTVRGSSSANRTFEPSRGGNRDEVEEHQREIDQDEEVRGRREEAAGRRRSARRNDEAERESRDERARTKFEAGPANATIASELRPPWRFDGLTGVGFAHPKPRPLRASR